jgi:hypothetical protein
VRVGALNNWTPISPPQNRPKSRIGCRRRAPAPAASSAKRAVPRPQFLTRVAVIEHSMRAASALLRLPPPPPPPPPPRVQSAAHLSWPRGLSTAASAPQGRSLEHGSGSRYFWMPQQPVHSRNGTVRCDDRAPPRAPRVKRAVSGRRMAGSCTNNISDGPGGGVHRWKDNTGSTEK